MIRTPIPLAPIPLAALALLTILSACATTAAPTLPLTQEQFWASLSSHCGKAYAGGLVSDNAADADFRGQAMVMHVRSCTDSRIAVPFHVQQADGTWDRSRTWVVTKTTGGLRLKHDHRHVDGSEDAVTQYGGDTAAVGTPRAQDFPVDAASIAMFQREGLDVSITNVWRVEVDPAGTSGARFAYQLTRRNDPARLFRVEFDTGNPVPAPPAPWGHD